MLSHLPIIIAVSDLIAVHVDAIIVVLGVHDQPPPLPPAGGDVRAVVLVQVLAEVAWGQQGRRHLRHKIKKKHGVLKETEPLGACLILDAATHGTIILLEVSFVMIC